MPAALESLRRAAAELKADFVRVEPQRAELRAAALEALGAIKISEASPEHTRIIDLTKDEAELRSRAERQPP
jgi:hypothetical protein